MDLEELKKIRENNFLKYKRKKKAYYLKNKKNKNIVNYEEELKDSNFLDKIKEIAHVQKNHIDNRRESIVNKIKDYQEKKKKYYEENKNERLEYDKFYREQKREKLKKYRQEYYRKNKESILAKQKEKRRNLAKE